MVASICELSCREIILYQYSEIIRRRKEKVFQAAFDWGKIFEMHIDSLGESSYYLHKQIVVKYICYLQTNS